MGGFPPSQAPDTKPMDRPAVQSKVDRESRQCQPYRTRDTAETLQTSLQPSRP